MIIGKEAVGCEAIPSKACGIVTTVILNHLFFTFPKFLEGILPPGWNYTDSSSRSESPFQSNVSWITHKAPCPHVGDDYWANADGRITVTATCKTLKGYPTHAYFNGVRVNLASWSHAITPPFKCREYPIHINPEWAIALNDWMTDKVSEASLTRRHPHPTLLQEEIEKYIETCTIPFLTPKYQPVIAPLRWTPQITPVCLAEHARDRASDFKFATINGRSIDHVGYSKDYQRLIIFFTDKTQLVVPVADTKDLIHRDSNPVVPASATPAPPQEFDPFQL